MNNFMIGGLGVVAGLAVALVSNLLILPWALSQQAATKQPGWFRLPPRFERKLGLDESNTASTTKFIYRVLVPICWAIVGASLAIHFFGMS